MRQFLQIVEEMVVPSLFHGSRTQFPEGTILTPQSEGYVVGTGLDHIERIAHQRTEAILDRYRPQGAVSRAAAVFMCDKIDDIDPAGGYVDYVYAVEPIGAVTRCNLHWYSELYSMALDDELAEETAKDIAMRYWSAAASENPLYEYLAPSARIVALIEVN